MISFEIETDHQAPNLDIIDTRNTSVGVAVAAVAHIFFVVGSPKENVTITKT